MPAPEATAAKRFSICSFTRWFDSPASRCFKLVG